MEKKQNVPALRFQGFSGEWKERKIEDITGIAYGGGTPSTQYAGFWQGTIPWIQSSDVIEDELWSISPRKHISKEAVKYSAAKVIPKNSIAIITRVGVGKVAFLPFDYATSQDFLSLSRLKIDERFGTYAVWKKINADAGLVQGTSIKGITREEVLAKIIKVPVAENEAKQIGSFFYQFDKKIGEIKSKIQKLQQFRQAMLAKLFPREGAAEPELRFRGFSGKWESIPLGEVGSAQSGVGFPECEQGGQHGIPFFKVSDMNNIGNEREMKVAKNYVTDEQIVNNGWHPIEDVPAIMFAKVGAAVMLNRKRLIRTPFLLDNNTMAYKLDKSWDAGFAQALFEQIDLTSLIQVGALPSYNASDVEGIIVKRPELNEQKAIGDFFYRLDRYISLQQKKLERMQRLKAALLEKLFV